MDREGAETEEGGRGAGGKAGARDNSRILEAVKAVLRSIFLEAGPSHEPHVSALRPA